MDDSWPVATPATIESHGSYDVPPGARCGVHDTADARFLCVVCGTFGCADCVFATGERGTTCKTCAAPGLAEPVPWERRAQLGWPRAFWDTTKLVCMEPKRFFSTPSTESGMAGPIGYALAAYTLGGMILMLSLGLVFLVIGGGAAIAGEEELGAVFGIYGGCITVGFLPLALLSYPVQGLMQVLIAAGCCHGTLVLLKARRGTFEQTLRAICYANGPHFWMFVPCIGWYFSTFWVWGVQAIALRETHRTTTDRAVLAAIGFRIVFTLLIVGLYVVLIGAAFAIEAAQGRGLR